jgi:hypothetical protein
VIRYSIFAFLEFHLSINLADSEASGWAEH